MYDDLFESFGELDIYKPWTKTTKRRTSLELTLAKQINCEPSAKYYKEDKHIAYCCYVTKKNIFEPWRKYYREEDTPRTDQDNVKNRKANL